MGCRIEGRTITLLTRQGDDWTEAFPTVVAGARRLKARTALLDGEVAAVFRNGRTSLQALQTAGAGRATIAYFIFDLLYLDGVDLAPLGIEERKSRLRDLLSPKPPPSLRFVEHVVGNGVEYFSGACARRLEGIVSKARSGPYRPGERHPSWVKTKCVWVPAGKPRSGRDGVGPGTAGGGHSPATPKSRKP
jgi:bifunctional non-homologous end joining protein LigD